MRKTAMLMGLLCSACVPEGGGGVVGHDGGGPAAADGGLVGELDVGPGGPGLERFPFATVEPACLMGDVPALRLDLRDVDRCGRVGRNDRVELVLGAVGAMRFPVQAPVAFNVGPDAPAQAVWVDELGAPRDIEAGLVRLDRFDLEAGASGTYVLVAEGGEELTGRFDATACEVDPGEHCYDEQPPPPADDADCRGRYRIGSWQVESAAFNVRFINQTLVAGLGSGELSVDLAFGDATLDWQDMANGGPDPRVPRSPATPIEWSEDGVRVASTAPGELFTLIPPTDFYPDAPEVVWHLEAVQFEGSFEAACEGFSGTLFGAFRTAGFSIPGQADVDLDGDGVNESMSVRAVLGATRRP